MNEEDPYAVDEKVNLVLLSHTVDSMIAEFSQKFTIIPNVLLVPPWYSQFPSEIAGLKVLTVVGAEKLMVGFFLEEK